MIRRITALLAAVALAILIGCSSTSPKMSHLVPDRLELDPAVAHAFNALNTPKAAPSTPAEIEAQQRLRRKRELLQADQLTEQGKEHYNNADYKAAIEQFTAAERHLKNVSSSSERVLQKLRDVQAYLGYSYFCRAEELMARARDEIDMAKRDLETRFLDKATGHLREAVDYWPQYKKEKKQLDNVIEDTRDQIEIDLKTRPEYILKQLGDLEREIKDKLEKRRLAWLAAKAEPSKKKTSGDDPTVAQINEMLKLYGNKTNAAKEQFGEELTAAFFPEFRLEADAKWEAKSDAQLRNKSGKQAEELRQRARSYAKEAEQAGKEGNLKTAVDKHRLAFALLSRFSTPSADTRDTARILAKAREAAKEKEFQLGFFLFDSAKNLLPKSDDSSVKQLKKVIEAERRVLEVERDELATRLDPEYGTALHRIQMQNAEAKVFAQHRVFKRARNAYEDILLKDPQNQDAIIGLRHLYEELREAAKLRRRASEAERKAEIEWKWVERGAHPDEKKIPRLGDLPVTGRLFRTEPKAVRALPIADPDEIDEVWIIAREQEAADAKSSYVPRADLLTRDPKTKQVVPLPLKHTDVKAEVSAFVAKVLVEQQFQNPFKEKIEAVYVFPLPEDAAVTDFIMTIGERKIRGLIREKEEAEQIYQEAKAAGYAAALLTQHRPNIFRQQVANIEPGKQIDIQMTYFNTLRYVDGAMEFNFPMVVGPRFNPPTGTEPPPAVSYLAPNERSGHDISLSLKVDAGMPIGEVECPTHAVNVEKPSATQLAVTLKDQATFPNKDFVLRYRIAEDTMKTGFMVHRGKDANTFALMLIPPKELKDIPRQKREMIFVLDCSGSMNGAPLTKCKEAVRHALSKLDADDTFQIIRFSESAYKLGKQPIAATKANIAKGLKFLDSLNSGGGTMMIEGIKSALDMDHTNGRLRIVSFMTDGYIGNEAQILREIRNRLGNARIFAFGIGSSVNRYLITSMGVEGNGASAVITLNEDPKTAVDAFYEKVAHSPLAEIDIDWNGLQVCDIYPKRVGDLIVGKPVLVTGKFEGELPDSINVFGLTGDGSAEFPINVNVEPGSHDGIQFIWARNRIAELAMADIHAPGAERKAEMTQFSIDHSVLCRYTAFLAVDTLRKTTGPDGKSVQIAIPVPDSVNHESTVE